MLRNVLFVLGAAFLPVAVHAQEFRGSLSGRVVDQQQAVVPNAKIFATETETGAKFQTVSNAEGGYVLPFLPPGPYSVTAEAPGFKRYINANVRVTTNEREQLDIQLEIGAVDQSVTITAEASMLETATASIGQVINTRQIENMPMNGRTPLLLAQLAFGVTPNSDPKFSRPFDNAGPSDFSLGGAPSRSNELLIDGSPDTTRDSRVAYNPPVDAVQEVKVEAFQSDAAYGHTAGGTVNVVMRGGTNQVHGTAYDFNQVSRLAATPWLTNKNGQKKPQSIFNQWGITAGGPLYLPKLFNGRDRMFWYFAYEGIRDAFPEPLTRTVATAAERNGDFSQLLTVGANYAIYDPLTGVREGSRVRRQVFPGNLIPAERLSPIAKKFLEFVPLPNQAGQKDGLNNYLADSTRRDVFDGELGRLDYNISERHKFFFNFRHNDRVENRSNLYHNIATGNFLSRINWGSMVDDVFTLSPTMVLNTRLNWTRFTEGNDKPSAGYDFTQLGFPKSLAAQSQKLVLPLIDMDQFTDWGTDAGDRTPFDIFTIFTSLTKIQGSHTLKFGADIREYRESRAGYGNSSGSYTFRADYVRGPLDNSTAAPLGHDIASLMLGYPTGGSFDINTFRTNQAKYYSVFVQDDLRVRSNLTINLGLRLEGDLGTTERFNRSVNGFDPSAASPIGPAAEAAYAKNPIPGGVPASQFDVKGGLLFAGPNGKYVYEPKGTYFSPRFGLAWTPGGAGSKTVVRGGFGVFIAGIGTIGINQTGFSQSTPVLGSSSTGGLRPAVTLDNPFPGGILQPTGSSLGAGTYMGRGLTFYNPNPLNPYSVRWNFDVQRQIGNGLVFEIGYTGNHAVHLTIDQQQDYIPAQYQSTSPFRDQAVIDRNSANVANPFAGLIPDTSMNGSTVGFSQLVRPYPHFTGITMQAANAASSYFHALQVRLEKRFSHGLQFLANYQWARTIALDNYLNEFGPLEKRPANIDRPQRFVTSFSYELPFGQGKPVLGSVSGFSGAVVDRIVGGWVINGIYSYESGGPVGNWGDVIYMGGPLNWDATNPDKTFDTTPFNRVSTQQLSNHVRTFPTRFGNLRSAPSNNFDFSILKNTRIRERVSLQFRTEFFNGFNHPLFAGPQLSPTSSAFGTISAINNLERHIQMALRLSW
jgi:hypothetical protein